MKRFLLLPLCLICCAAAAQTRITDLRVQHAREPLAVEDRHPVDRRAFRKAGGGIDNIVRADDDRKVAVREVGIYLLHLEEFFVINVDLSQKDVHVAGHTSCDGMDRKSHGLPAAFKRVAQLLDL